MGAVYNTVSQYLPFLRKKPSMTRDQALRTRPVRNPVLKWHRNAEGEMCLRIPRKNDRTARLFARMLRAPDYKEINLDEVGSDIWEICDGEHSFESIVSFVAAKYKLTRQECETSVAAYLKMLGDRRLIGFQVGGRPTAAKGKKKRKNKQAENR